MFSFKKIIYFLAANSFMIKQLQFNVQKKFFHPEHSQLQIVC